ncbi:MAG: glycosyltransferase family 4 protein [Pseudomonadales bacterium]|jgi:glycosyltransferase involved in cell wall biosynthesis|nr:glycosyltransferase family 4 protein [Pseudomonadales bacterium]
MKIGIDCRLFGKKHAGIGRYIENLVVRLPYFLPNHDFVYFFHDKGQLAELMKLLGQIDLPKTLSVQEFFEKVQIVYAPIKHYTLKEQREMPKIFETHHLDLLHVPHFNAPIFYKGKMCITIFDLLWHEYKGGAVTTLSPIAYRVKYLAYKLVTAQAVKKALVIFYSAQVVKKSILKYYPKVKNKLVLTQYGVTLPLASKVRPSLIKQLPQQPYLLYVGSLYPHKNIKIVLEAMTKNQKLLLVCVGSRNVFQDRIKAQVEKLDLKNRVFFLGYVADEELSYLYQHCQALVQPSLSEGFGLTGVEAMGVGAPVLASDIPIFKEIYGEAAFIFDPHNSNSFLTTLNNLEKTNRQKIIEQGKKQASKYNWDDMIKTVVQTYEKLLAK